VKRDFAYVLGGRERGPDAEPDNLIPACVAWYVGERGRLVEQHKLKPAVAKVLNEHLVKPCDKDTLSETGWDSSRPIWRNARKWSQAILRVDHTLLRRHQGPQYLQTGPRLVIEG
jgi:hypothetical protein